MDSRVQLLKIQSFVTKERTEKKREIIWKRKNSNTYYIQVELFWISLREILKDSREAFSSVGQQRTRITLHHYTKNLI